jgi:hypothetical protein
MPFFDKIKRVAQNSREYCSDKLNTAGRYLKNATIQCKNFIINTAKTAITHKRIPAFALIIISTISIGITTNISEVGSLILLTAGSTVVFLWSNLRDDWENNQTLAKRKTKLLHYINGRPQSANDFRAILMRLKQDNYQPTDDEKKLLKLIKSHDIDGISKLKKVIRNLENQNTKLRIANGVIGTATGVATVFVGNYLLNASNSESDKAPHYFQKLGTSLKIAGFFVGNTTNLSLSIKMDNNQEALKSIKKVLLNEAPASPAIERIEEARAKSENEIDRSRKTPSLRRNVGGS